MMIKIGVAIAQCIAIVEAIGLYIINAPKRTSCPNCSNGARIRKLFTLVAVLRITDQTPVDQFFRNVILQGSTRIQGLDQLFPSL
ncbi:hypothetical protein D3C73_1286690 [compost metagenome]